MLHFIRSLLTKDPATPETDPILDPCPVDYVLDALEKVSRAMARAADSRGFELTLEESRRFHALCGELLETKRTCHAKALSRRYGRTITPQEIGKHGKRRCGYGD